MSRIAWLLLVCCLFCWLAPNGLTAQSADAEEESFGFSKHSVFVLPTKALQLNFPSLPVGYAYGFNEDIRGYVYIGTVFTPVNLSAEGDYVRGLDAALGLDFIATSLGEKTALGFSLEVNHSNSYHDYEYLAEQGTFEQIVNGRVTGRRLEALVTLDLMSNFLNDWSFLLQAGIGGQRLYVNYPEDYPRFNQSDFLSIWGASDEEDFGLFPTVRVRGGLYYNF